MRSEKVDAHRQITLLTQQLWEAQMSHSITKVVDRPAVVTVNQADVVRQVDLKVRFHHVFVTFSLRFLHGFTTHLRSMICADRASTGLTSRVLRLGLGSTTSFSTTWKCVPYGLLILFTQGVHSEQSTHLLHYQR